ncbi:MAG: AsmA family protein [Alphaproteobacteria bacterium]
MKLALKAIFGVLAICLAAIIIVPLFINLNNYKSQAIELVEDKTGLDVTINGDLSFTVLPSPNFSVSDVSIKEDKNNDTLLSFNRLDIKVNLLPLLSGDVQVKSISLIEPSLLVEKNKDGTINLTSALKQKRSGEEETEGTNTSEKTAINIPQISLDSVRIKDGELSYIDHASGENKLIRNINTEISAQSLSGPFTGDGSLFYDGYSLDFDVSTDKYDTQESVINPKIKLSVQPIGINIEFSGALNMGGGMQAQGHMDLSVNDLSGITPDMHLAAKTSFGASGIVSVTEKKLEMSSIDGHVGDDKFSGSVNYDLTSLKTSLKIKSLGNIDLAKAGLKSIPYKLISFDINALGDNKAIQFEKTSLTLDGEVFNVSGKYAFGAGSKHAALDIDVKTKKFDFDKFNGKTQAGSGKASGVSAANKGSVNGQNSSVVLPFDAAISFNTDALIYQGATAKNLNADVKISGKKLDVENFSIADYLGASLKASGSVGDIQSLTAINAYLDINAKDVKALLAHFGTDTSAMPKAVNSGALKLKLTGSKSTAELTANIAALNGEFIAKGTLNQMMTKPSVQNLVVQAKHKNMAQLMNLLSGSQINDPSLNKPMDIYTKVNQSGNRYEFTGLKGDLSGATIQGSASVDLGGKTPLIEGDLTFGDIKMASVVNKKSGSGGSSNASSASNNKPASPRWSKEAIDTAALHAVNINVSMKANSIQYGDWPLKSPSLNVTLKNGVLVVSDLKAEVFGGNINLGAKLQSVVQPRQPVHFESETTFNNVDVGSLATSLIGTKLVKISGKSNLSMSIKSSGASPAALVHDLSGQGSVNGQNIVLDGVDVVRFVRALSYDSKPGDTVMGLWKGTTKGGQTKFNTLDGSFTIQQGIVNISKMDLDGTRAAIETRGNINLPNWTIATKHKMIAKSTEDAPTDIPPFELSVNGSLDNPGQTFGQGVLQDYLNRKIQRKFNKLISDKLGLPSNDVAPASGDESQNQESQDQQSQENKPQDIEGVAEEAIKGILGDLLR